ncbi:nuclear transport factor 2 family protein [Longivirga aurantiaca]|uniref:Nuclear transport factor 2 family protein n=1 Tax=Longivirga aurantiaca TaxID=1837743 RepID=A0ABW1SY78_9ACTN
MPTASGDAASRLDALEARLRLLEDERAIRDLLSTYSSHADAMRDDDWLALWSQDGAIEVAMGEGSALLARPGRWSGPEGLRAFITNPDGHQRPGFYGRSMHMHGNNSIVVVDGDDARATTYSLLLQRIGDQTVVVGAGVSAWRFRREEGSWVVVERRRSEVGAAETAELLGTTR